MTIYGLQGNLAASPARKAWSMTCKPSSGHDLLLATKALTMTLKESMDHVLHVLQGKLRT
jgi:hypothetical protein